MINKLTKEQEMADCVLEELGEICNSGRERGAYVTANRLWVTLVGEVGCREDISNNLSEWLKYQQRGVDAGSALDVFTDVLQWLLDMRREESKVSCEEQLWREM